MKRICISACLAGEACRYDGKSKSCDLSSLGDDVEKIFFCPEMAAGLGCPRPPIELVENADSAPLVLRVHDRSDVTSLLRKACLAKADELLASGGVDAFILKARSPSCGRESPLHDVQGNTIGIAPGEWVRVIRERFPSIPIRTEEDC